VSPVIRIMSSVVQPRVCNSAIVVGRNMIQELIVEGLFAVDPQT